MLSYRRKLCLKLLRDHLESMSSFWTKHLNSNNCNNLNEYHFCHYGENYHVVLKRNINLCERENYLDGLGKQINEGFSTFVSVDICVFISTLLSCFVNNKLCDISLLHTQI